MKPEGMKKAIPLALIVSVVLIVAGLIAWGEPVTVGGAEDVAGAFIGYERAKSEVYRAAMGIPADVRLDEVNVLTDGTSPDTLAYVFELKPSGYIVVTADTQIVPIVAYSFTGTFSWEESVENILLDMLRQDMGFRLEAVRQGRMDPEIRTENSDLWDEYLGRRTPDRTIYSPKVYGPWTSNPWSQGSPYYDDCPTDPVTLNRCVVGCVATALAQILNYWQYPTSVTFTASDNYTTSTRNIFIDATTGSFVGLNYNNCSPSDAAKADLSFAAGISVRMDYTSTGSGATTAKVAPALAGSWYPWSSPPPQRWGYISADLRTYNADYSWWGSPYYTTEASFFNQLSTDMTLGRPVELSIKKSTSSGGHAIVVDGWKSGREYHLNYGWGTYAYGWYIPPSGMPYGYDIIKYAVMNIVPTTTTYSLSTGTSGNGSVAVVPNQTNLTAGTHAILSATPMPGCHFDHWQGDVSGTQNPAMLILDGNKSVTGVFGGNPGVVSTKEWTVIVYLAADNNLGGGTPSDPDFMDIDEMESALTTSNAAVNVVVLWDKPGTNNTMIYWVQPDAVEGSLATYTLGVNLWPAPGGPEENMGNQSTLTNFLDWVSDKFVSNHYALILWNHGAGWQPREKVHPVEHSFVLESGETFERTFWETVEEKDGKAARDNGTAGEPWDLGICWDDTDGGDYLTTKEIVNGIAGSILDSVDNLGMDACLMQMLEVAYEMRWVASYLTASEESEWGYGWAYHQILAPITIATTPLQLAHLWGSTRSGRFMSGGLDTISSLDLAKIGSLASNVSNLALQLVALITNPFRYYELLEAKLLEAFSFAYPQYVDLDDFCTALIAVVNDGTTHTLANAVRVQIANTVVAMSNAPAYSSVGGIAIYFPHYHEIYWESIPHTDYRNEFFAFCTDHLWDDLVNAWLATDYADPFESNNSPSTAYDFGAVSGTWSRLEYEADFDDDVGLYTADWYKLTVNCWFSFDLWAWCTEYNSDTLVYVYDSLTNANAGIHFLYDDDSAYGYGSRTSASNLAPGTYYVKVASWFYGSGVDEDYALWLNITKEVPPPTAAVFRIEALTGDVLADGPFYGASFNAGSADVAEWVPVSEPVEPGDVLELDPNRAAHYRKSRSSCSTLVAGVVSTNPGVILGSSSPALDLGLWTDGSRPVTEDSRPWTDDSRLATEDSALLALIGIVPVKVTDEGGPIQPGDLLVSSSTPGYAMRWNPESGEACGLIGKALEPLDSGTGVIQVLLMR